MVLQGHRLHAMLLYAYSRGRPWHKWGAAALRPSVGPKAPPPWERVFKCCTLVLDMWPQPKPCNRTRALNKNHSGGVPAMRLEWMLRIIGK